MAARPSTPPPASPRGLLFDLRAGNAEESVAQGTAECAPQRPRTLIQGALSLLPVDQPNVLGREHPPSEPVVGGQQLGATIGVGVGELELDPRGLDGGSDGDLQPLVHREAGVDGLTQSLQLR